MRLLLIEGLAIYFAFSEMTLLSYCGKLSHIIINELKKVHYQVFVYNVNNKLSLRCAMEVLREVIKNSKK